MKINNAINQLNHIEVHHADNVNALKTAEKSLKEWNELYEEILRVAIVDRADLIGLIERHIARIEA
jgi:hypothetical protein